MAFLAFTMYLGFNTVCLVTYAGVCKAEINSATFTGMPTSSTFLPMGDVVVR